MGGDQESMIEVNVKESDLRYVRYDFWLKGTTLYLERMMVLERKTKRHGLKIVYRESYSRLNDRDFGIKEEPEVDIEIQLEAIREAKNMIKFEKWRRQ